MWHPCLAIRNTAAERVECHLEVALAVVALHEQTRRHVHHSDATRPQLVSSVKVWANAGANPAG